MSVLYGVEYAFLYYPPIVFISPLWAPSSAYTTAEVNFSELTILGANTVGILKNVYSIMFFG